MTETGVLYFIFCDGSPLSSTADELTEVCARAGYALICPQAKDGDHIRPLTEAEISSLPIDENDVFVKLAMPDENGFVVLYHTKLPPSSFEHAKWPNGRVGNKTDLGYPFLVPLRDLFPQLAQLNRK